MEQMYFIDDEQTEALPFSTIVRSASLKEVECHLR